MKYKNLRINDQLVSTILYATITIGSIVGTCIYYNHNSKEQSREIEINKNNIFMNENGEYCCYFDVGEHVITISRNDAYYHMSEEIEGYVIKDVEINGWRDNNKITYVNNEPVIVVSTGKNNGQLQFNDFGTIITEKNNVKTKKI